ncbi:MAG: hypothetical protein JSR98_03945 [Proteobacteria bacterium]|nr:hypothetical protein [Pseudomonadota bacterium]
MKAVPALVLALAVLAATPALAQTHYMLCFGGGRAALYWSAVFPVPESTKSADSQKAFNAFVQAKYGKAILSECHRNQTQAIADADKKQREASDQTSKYPSKIIETGWTGR